MYLLEDTLTKDKVTGKLIAAGYGDTEYVGSEAYWDEFRRCFVTDEAHLSFGSAERYIQTEQVRYLPHAVEHRLKCAGYKTGSDAYLAEQQRCFQIDDTFESPTGELRYHKVNQIERFDPAVEKEKVQGLPALQAATG